MSPPETYIVAEVLQPGWVQTSPVDGNYTIDLDAGENLEEINFGNATLPGSISGYKWNDLNGDGVWDNDEPGLAQWEIYLDQNQNSELDPDEPSTVTDQDGNYTFSDLEAGTYTIAEVLKPGWLQTFPTLDPSSGGVEPDDYSNGTVLNTVEPGVSLTGIGTGVTTDEVTATTTTFSSTGVQGFGNSGSSLWWDGSAELRADFDLPVSTVSIDFISDDSSDIGQLEAYDTAGNLLETYTTASLSTGQSETMMLTRPTADIAYILASGQDGSSIGYLDNLSFGGGSSDSHTVELGIGEDLSDFNFGNVDIGGADALFFEDFADNDAGWTLDPEWEIGTATASSGERYGNPDPDTDHTPTDDNGVAGVVIGGNASQTVHDFYYLTSPVINTDVSGDVFLEFQRWLNSDYQPYMSNTVEVFDGTDWQVIWNTAGEPGILDDVWTEQQFDITAYKNTDLQVRFGFEVGSDRVFPVSSWNIDDFKIYTEEPTETIMGETGIVTNLTHNSQTILLDQSYENPVVLAQPLSRNGGQPATVRITDVSSDSFTFYVQEPSNLDGTHAAESVSYIVLEEGVWELDDGTVVEVGSLESDATVKQVWESINFEGDCDYSYIKSEIMM